MKSNTYKQYKPDLIIDNYFLIILIFTQLYIDINNSNIKSWLSLFIVEYQAKTIILNNTFTFEK